MTADGGSRRDADPPRDADLPVVAPPDAVDDPLRDGPVAGVLLAAGTSSRYGEANKLLADLSGEPVVRRAARALVEADLDRRVAVVGHEAARVREALSGLGFEFVRNPDYADGESTSVRAGVAALREGGSSVDAVVIALGDMPAVSSGSVDALVRAYRAGLGTALAAACDRRRGNPVLFDATHFDALTDVTGDAGGRDLLLSGDDAALVETGDPGVLRDVDTPDDLDAAR